MNTRRFIFWVLILLCGFLPIRQTFAFRANTGFWRNASPPLKTPALYCWGKNNLGQLGDGTSTTSASPMPTVLPSGVASFQSVAVGYSHGCALADTGEIFCWGYNSSGQLGNNTSTASLVPVLTTFPSGVSSFSPPALGDDFGCAIGDNGSAYCWGNGGDYRLGNGSLSNVKVPSLLPFPSGVTSFSYVAGGGRASNYARGCAIANTGAAYCWGSGANGETGNGTTTSPTPLPTLVTFPSGVSSFSKIALGQRLTNKGGTCALADDGLIYCWGDAKTLGNGSTTDSSLPQLISVPSGVTSFSDVAVGAGHACGLADTGQIYCWGLGSLGQLGDGLATQSLTPVAVSFPSGVSSFTSVSVKYQGTCAIGNNKQAYCWGSGTNGQLGDGGSVDRSSPVAVSMPSGYSIFTAVTSGYLHSCGIVR